MPLPKHPLTLHGGCNCRAIRYRISVPPYDERPTAPYHKPDTNLVKNALPHIPCVLMDHCNDCRRATSAILPMAMVTATSTVEISCLSREQLGEERSSNKASLADEGREWQPLSSMIDPFENNPGTSNQNTTFGHYVSSPNRNRWFCTNCGTPFGYSATYSAYPEPWKAASVPRMFDVWLGTLDREVLVNEWMRPDYAVWCHFAIPWVSDLARHGAKKLAVEGDVDMEENGKGDGIVKTEPIPRHPLFMIDQEEGEDVNEWLTALKK